MENKNGNGLFLGIVSVATLIVAIIGATFAYFSANTQSAENAVEVGAYEYNLSLSMNQIYPENVSPKGLIPLLPDAEIEGAEAPNNINLLYALNVAKKKCIDDNGMQVCALYQVLITNQATNPVTLKGQIKTTSNIPGTPTSETETRTGFVNLTYQSLIGNHEDNTLAKNPEFSTPVTLASETEGENTVNIADIYIPGATVAEDSDEITPGVGSSYVLIYLNDKGDQSAEMGARFTGQVIYSSSGDASTGLTGTFKVGGTEEEPEAGE